MAEHETWMAFDYGLKRIGLAVGQSQFETSRPLAPLPARDGIPQWEQIALLLEEWRPSRLLIGLPLNMDGSESELARRARKFANRLHGRFGLPIVMVDERLSTREAKERAHERGHGGNYRLDPVDSLAAEVILESYRAEQRQTSA